MADVTQILSRIESGDPNAADQLLPLVYDELRKLASARLACERPGHTLQATALVHEAYLRLLGSDAAVSQLWNGRGHFFAAAAEAMRRILVESARRKKSIKAGGDRHQVDFPDVAMTTRAQVDVLALSEALDNLEAQDARKAAIVKLRYFVGLTITEAADALGVSRATADNDWAYAKSWLKVRLGDVGEERGDTSSTARKEKNR